MNSCLEDTLWTGIPSDFTNPDAPEALSVVRKFVDDGQYAEASAAAVKLFGKPADVCCFFAYNELILLHLSSPCMSYIEVIN